ncbi:hypothetical protein KXV68_002849 [Aspergillus fumigatus]|nr:hypothetical protein KXX67_000337 [Aspergillus fumigatus]KAH1662799.1 hypothetical protein KXX15_000395 [Aspergillus fumigatus]KAH1696085.1 hypothetical protein KXX23_000525 [Aspergillus fumigatus]KAH1724535.1 hypothetical protein KXX25_000685 [Aspergillus fumigatus]KAH1724765.1 hypothetical protein KXX40_000696 [Aspergillus fumigatus]
MASPATTKSVLIVGATGYIGGSILTELLQSPEASELSISALIRRPEQAARLQSLGVKPLEFKGLDDLDACRDAASQHDVVINAASASHDSSAKALIEGLSQRQKATGRDAYMIHTSGTSILGDHPYSGTPQNQKVWSDEKDDVYAMEKNHPERYGQRVTDVTVVETGLSLGVKTYIVVPPTIYGKGSGPFATLSQQIWNHVHILDLANFYLLLFRAVREQPDWLPSGPKAIFFVESGEHTWLQVSQGIADALHKQGLLDSNKVESISMKDAAAEITRGNESLVEITLASNSRARADFARKRLGWKTSRGNEDFLNHFDGEIEAMREELQSRK